MVTTPLSDWWVTYKLLHMVTTPLEGGLTDGFVTVLVLVFVLVLVAVVGL